MEDIEGATEAASQEFLCKISPSDFAQSGVWTATDLLALNENVRPDELAVLDRSNTSSSKVISG